MPRSPCPYVLVVQVLLFLSGCAARPVGSAYYQEQWVIMRAGKVAFLSDLVPGVRRCAENWGGPFENRKSVGPYQILSRPGAALLLDARGEPIWAGTYAIPLRVDGRLGCVLLLSAPLWEDLRDRGVPFDIDCLCFARARHELVNIAIAAYIPVNRDDCRTSPWVFDLDGDGTDEFLLADTDGIDVDGVQYSCELALVGWGRNPGWHEGGEERTAIVRLGVKCTPGDIEVALLFSPQRKLDIFYNDPTGKRVHAGTVTADQGKIRYHAPPGLPRGLVGVFQEGVK
jgi:hypothetical protein